MANGPPSRSLPVGSSKDLEVIIMGAIIEPMEGIFDLPTSKEYINIHSTFLQAGKEKKYSLCLKDQ